jgi:hypothetical protein
MASLGLRARTLPVLLASLGAVPAAAADDTDTEVKFSGRIAYGAVYRMEAPDPSLLTSYNAAAIGLAGTGMGPNADDANLNYARHDAVSRALLGSLELRFKRGDLRGAARVDGWRDFALRNDARPWGNAINGYAAGQPLGDEGADRLAQFSGVALGEAWLEQGLRIGDLKLLGRAGRQAAPWSERGAALETIGARNMAAMRRAGTTPQATRIASPMLFGRIEFTPSVALEGFVQSFRASAVDVCGTFWSVNDYAPLGCNLAMVGPPAGTNDRARVRLGAFMQRTGTVEPESRNRGIALFWAPPGGATALGLYHARYGWRMPMPSLVRSTRVGAPIVAGNPDGRNQSFLVEYPDNTALTALTLTQRVGAATVAAELSYRAGVPFMISPADVVPAFMSATAASLLRERANAVPPGGIFHGFDLYGMSQLQLSLQRRWNVSGLSLNGSIEVLAKHTPGLPDQQVLRYGRSDIYGTGPVNGICNVTTGDAARQCSSRGYQTANAWGYRLRMEAGQVALAPGLQGQVILGFNKDVKGWSGDFSLNEGRRTLTLALRMELAQRYFGEIGYFASMGGDYSTLVDRDTMLVAAGVRF